MTRDVKILRDGFSTLERGMDSGRDPVLIEPNQMAFGVNTRVRGGFVTHRPGYRKLNIQFGDTVVSRFTEGRWQGAKYYNPRNGGKARIVCAIGGRMFVFTPDQQSGRSNSVQEITPTQHWHTLTSVSFTMPAVGDTVEIVVNNATFLEAGQSVTIENAGTLVVTEVLSTVKFTARNDGESGNEAPGTLVLFLNKVSVSETHKDINNPYRWQVWMEQAEDFLIIQDGQARPIIYNGSTARRAGNDEIQTGTAMAYGLGRLWVARGREFIASDIVGGPTGTDLYNKRDAVLKFTENDYIAEGGAFLAPETITGMAFPSNLDTSLGEGELVVFYRGGAVTVRVPASREDWKNLSIPLQRVSLKPYGATGQNNIVDVNGDFWFRSVDGLRSFVMAQRQYGEWGNVPMSREMNAVLSEDDERLFHTTSGVLFDNRLLMTCVGQRDFDRGNYYKALVALDFDPVSGMLQRLPPAYDGVWTGLNIHQVVAGEFDGQQRCFAFVRNSYRELEVWEITKNDIVDRPSSDDEVRIEWKVTPKALIFEDGGDGLKRLAAARLWIAELRGDTRFCVEYRPDQYPVWQTWGECWTKKATKQWCVGEDCIPQIPLPQHRTKMRLPQILHPSDEVSDGKPMNLGHEFQVRITVNGSCKIRRMRVKAEIVQEEQDYGRPVEDEANVIVNGCPDSFLTHDSAEGDSTYLTTESGALLTTESGVSLIL